MNKLFFFEIKRMKYKKIHIILPLIVIAIGLIGIISGNAFNEAMTNEIRMVNVFQAYTQFSFIFLGFIYIYLFCEDYSKGTDQFISQLGYSKAKQIFIESIILYLYTILIVMLFIVAYALSIGCFNLSYLMLILFAIVAGTLFTLMFSCFLSMVFKKALNATAFQFLFFILFDVLNIFAYGLTNPCDSNSLATVTIRYLSGISVTHKSLSTLDLEFEKMKWVYTICPSLVYSGILFVAIFVLLSFNGGSTYVTKHKK